MPADLPGVTTDGHGHPPSGGDRAGERPVPAASPSAAHERGPAGDIADGGGNSGAPAWDGGDAAWDGGDAATGVTAQPRPPDGDGFRDGRDPGPATHPGPATQPGPGPEPGGDGPPLSTPEPPPAPVLVPRAPGRRLLGRGRAAVRRRRQQRASARGLRVNQRLWSISPWSVLKISVLFYLCVGLILLVAGTLLYNAGRSVGTIDQFESFVTRIGAYGQCVPTAEVPEGTEFEVDDDKCGEGEVLVGGFALDDGTLFRAAAIGGGILVVAGSIGNALLTVLVNLLNEVTGGTRHTVIREPVRRPPGAPSPGPGGGRARPPAGARRPPGARPRGSPRRPPQR